MLDSSDRFLDAELQLVIHLAMLLLICLFYFTLFCRLKLYLDSNIKRVDDLVNVLLFICALQLPPDISSNSMFMLCNWGHSTGIPSSQYCINPGSVVE